MLLLTCSHGKEGVAVKSEIASTHFMALYFLPLVAVAEGSCLHRDLNKWNLLYQHLSHGVSQFMWFTNTFINNGPDKLVYADF